MNIGTNRVSYAGLPYRNVFLSSGEHIGYLIDGVTTIVDPASTLSRAGRIIKTKEE